MSCFTKKMVNDPKFPKLSSEVKRLKDTEGGVNAMCQVMQHYENIARNEAKEEEKKRTAIELLKSGVDKAIVAKCTELTIPQLDQLLASAK